MNFKVNNPNFVKYLQEGGVAPEAAPAEAAPAPEQGSGDPMEQIVAACQQALQTQDCNLMAQICQAILQMAGGGVEEAPAAPEGQQPVYKKGGKLSKWISK